jgi:hypothetical protein
MLVTVVLLDVGAVERLRQKTVDFEYPVPGKPEDDPTNRHQTIVASVSFPPKADTRPFRTIMKRKGRAPEDTPLFYAEMRDA